MSLAKFPIAQLSVNVCILKSLLVQRWIFAISASCPIISLLSIVSVIALLLMLWICQLFPMIYSICLILLGSTSSVVVANNLSDWLVIVFTILLFSEKYHR